MPHLDCFSKAGRKGNNQDSILVSQVDARTLIAVADGMGGDEAGETASNIAIDILKSEFEKNIEIDFPSVFNIVKEKICAFANEHDIKKMGTTLTACLLDQDKAVVAHVGDTRLYHLRNDGILAITKDQTEVQVLIDEGILSKKRAEKYHRRNILISAITNHTDYSLDLIEFTVNDEDRLLLFSDGAYSLIKKLEIRDISVNETNVSSLVMKILELIESRTIKDDYSLVACEVKL